MHVHLSETKLEHEECKQRHGMTPAAYMEKMGLFDVPALAAHCVYAEDDDMDETTVKLANDNFTEVAKIILEGVGGKGNVASIDNCITRLRLEIKDYTAVDEKKIKSAGVAGVIRPGKNSVQVVIGTKVQFVADEFKKLCK